MSRKGTGPRSRLRPHGWQTCPTPSPAPAALVSRRHHGDATRASAPVPEPPPSAECCELVAKHRDPETWASSPPLPTLVPNARQAQRKRTKAPGPRQHPPPACPAPARPEIQDKGPGESEENEGQRAEAAWLGHLWGPSWEESKDWVAVKPSSHTHIFGTPAVFCTLEHLTPRSLPQTPYTHTPSPPVAASTGLHTASPPHRPLLPGHPSYINSSQGEKIT